MAKREKIKTTIQEAIDYWQSLIYEGDLSVDWEEAHTRCWRCGCTRHLERCHIIPHSLGGIDHPSNIVLLCKRCHADGPNVNDKEIMWDWIKSYKVPLYDTFWFFIGMKEYKFIYKKTLVQEIKDILKAANITLESSRINEILKEMRITIEKDASIHFGQPYFNTATIAGLIRIALKNLAKYYNVEFPIKSEEDEKGPIWYMEV